MKPGRGRGYTSTKGSIYHTEIHNKMARFSDIFKKENSAVVYVSILKYLLKILKNVNTYWSGKTCL